MKYAQLNEDGSILREINTRKNVEWDETHFCPPDKLTLDEAAYFRLVPVYELAAPTYDPMTQSCRSDGFELVDTQWQTKWVVEDLSAEQIAANQAAAQAALIASYTTALDAHIDATAQADKWDSRITCCLRAGYENPWQAKGIAFGVWMDTCYALSYQIMYDVQAATRPLPTIEEFLAEMPVMEWPT